MQRGSATSPTTNEIVQESARLQPQAPPPVADAVGNADALCELLKLIERTAAQGADALRVQDTKPLLLQNAAKLGRIGK